MSLGLKRILLVVMSLAGGVAGVFLVLGFLNLSFGAGVTLAEYGTIYAVLTAIPLALFIGIWLDYFMGTQLLRE